MLLWLVTLSAVEVQLRSDLYFEKKKKPTIETSFFPFSLFIVVCSVIVVGLAMMIPVFSNPLLFAGRG